MIRKGSFEISKARQQSAQSEALRRTGKTEKLPHELAGAAHALAAQFLAEAKESREIDCEKGCSFCCHQPATGFPFEAIRIAQALREKLSREELDAQIGKMRARVAGFEGRSIRGNINNKTACPLLGSDGSCSIYEHRPLTCRLAHSFSVKKCRASFQKDRNKVEIPVSLDLLQGISGIIEGAYEWLPKQKLDGGLYELCSAVLKALEDADSGRKWAAGDLRTFADCIRDDT